VNRYLWRGALESLHQFPVSMADFNSGLIGTEWVSFPQEPKKRFQIRVLIYSSELRCDSFQVTVLVQQKCAEEWKYIEAPLEISQKLREKILKSARCFYQNSPKK
jgi:hypothetical protein